MGRRRDREDGRSPYGKRGGTSATAGQRSATYEATAPDGTVLRKASFKARGADDATMIAHRGSDGVWWANCVYATDEVPDWATRMAKDGDTTALLQARRVR